MAGDRTVSTVPQLQRRLVLAVALVSLCVFVPCSWFGLSTLVDEWSRASRVIASQGWPTTPGLVISSSVQTNRQPGQKDTYLLQVTYEYTVAGTKHRSSTFTHAHRAWTRRKPDLLQGRVDVHYDPDDPGQAVLEPGHVAVLGLNVFGGLVCGFVPLLLGVVGGVGAIVMSRRVAREYVEETGKAARGELTPEQHLHNLAVAALADGELAAEEEAHLVRRAALWGLGDAVAVRRALEAVRGGERTLHLPDGEDARVKMYLTVVDQVRADGKLTEREQRMLDALAERAQVPPALRKHAES